MENTEPYRGNLTFAGRCGKEFIRYAAFGAASAALFKYALKTDLKDPMLTTLLPIFAVLNLPLDAKLNGSHKGMHRLEQLINDAAKLAGGVCGYVSVYLNT